MVGAGAAGEANNRNAVCATLIRGGLRSLGGLAATGTAELGSICGELGAASHVDEPRAPKQGQQNEDDRKRLCGFGRRAECVTQAPQDARKHLRLFRVDLRFRVDRPVVRQC